jgi:ankyrin repeat protein
VIPIHAAQNATPLLYACIQGFQVIVDKLIAQGATVDPEVAIVYNPKHDVVGPLTPLAAAAANGYDHIVDKLISTGAQVDRTLVPTQQEKKVMTTGSSLS